MNGSLGSRQSSGEIPVDCYRGVVDDSFRPAGESAGPFCEPDVGLFPLGLEGEADRFAVVGGVLGSAPYDHVVAFVRDCCDGDSGDWHVWEHTRR